MSCCCSLGLSCASQTSASFFFVCTRASLLRVVCFPRGWGRRTHQPAPTLLSTHSAVVCRCVCGQRLVAVSGADTHTHTHIDICSLFLFAVASDIVFLLGPLSRYNHPPQRLLPNRGAGGGHRIIMDSGIFFTASRNQCTCWPVIAMLVSWLFSASCGLFQPPSPLPLLWHS